MACECKWYCEQRPDCRAYEHKPTSCIGAMQSFHPETWKPVGKLWRFYRLDVPARAEETQ